MTMPKRSLLQQPPPPPFHHQTRLLPPVAAAVAVAFSFLLIFIICFRKITRKRTVPSDSKPPHRFSYSTLRRATQSFSSSLRLGQGGFGSVYRGTLPNNQNVAVKVMDSGSLQGEREFQNEIFFASKLESFHVVTAIGFSYDRKHRNMLLVYELMSNGNLQDALIHRKVSELMNWSKRFSVAVDVAKGLEYLHGLDPPVVHGDVKPSNVLLDECFNAKIADFGLAWVKSESQSLSPELNQNVGEVKIDVVGDGGGSVLEETESVTTTTGFEEFQFGVDQSPESFIRDPLTSPEMMMLEAVSASPEVNLDGVSVESAKELIKMEGKQLKSSSGKDWWFKQENGSVKDYVMEWIGTEIKKERPKSGWIGTSSSTTSNNQLGGKADKKKNKKRLDWWVSLDEDKEDKVLKKEKRKPPREWWKEEYCEELEKKKKKKKKQQKTGTNDNDHNGNEDWWPRDDESYIDQKNKKKKKKSKSRSSLGSVEWFSGEILRGQRSSHDSFSGGIPKSGGISSTPSMRGTVCYVAPECGGAGAGLSEKSDVYSYGVLLLVLVAGRRPLEVTSSPMQEFQRANLIHWARHLARTGKLLDLVDKSIQSLDSEQSTLCITIALLCLQKSPSRRPSMKEVVDMLTGECEAPPLPTEFSPSPPSRFPFKSRSHKKAW